MSCINPHTQAIWDHFFTMPFDGNRESFDQFYDAHLSLESRLLLPSGDFSRPVEFTHVEIGRSTKKAAPIAERRINCSILGCTMSCKRSPLLKIHVKKMHPDLFNTLYPGKKGKAYPCPVDACQSAFQRKHDLKRHTIMKHAGHSH